MPISDHDKTVLRRLAEQRAEIAALPVQEERRELWRRLNDLEPVKPLVWVNEICWWEFVEEEDLQLQTQDSWAQGLETQFRQELYQWEHLPGDMIVDREIWCPLAISDTGFGIGTEADYSATASGLFGAGRYHAQFATEADVARIQFPEVTHDVAATERNYEQMREVFDGIAPVVKRGICHLWFSPWDQLIQWWNVQQAMLDLVLKPELVHAAMDRLVSAFLYRLDQYEALGLLSVPDGNLRVGSGGLGYTKDLPPADYDPAHVRPRDQWGCATAQIFSEVSPAMHEEFALQYERRWLERFGLTYYGCCEPLHLKMDILRSVKNLRKVSMSFAANLARGVEETGGRYVMSLKPNPAIVAEDGWRPELARRRYRESLEITRGCPVEIVLKDISTVRSEPRRLWEWTRLASEEAERFA